ncbi:MAG: hypothetical protein LBU58_11475 [Clostridiales bacterium]|jgi:ABC-type glycerol-3-phosphate transport system substrate-binding protein|nr:hypothetical protein [Clostridiales bacterium]
MSLKRTTSLFLAVLLLIAVAVSGCTPAPTDTTTAAATTAAATTAAATTAAEAATTAAEAATTAAAATTTAAAAAEAAAPAASGGFDRTPASLKMLYLYNSATTYDPWRDTAVGKALAELTKVDLEMEFLVGADARQKASLLIAAGEYPDLLSTGESSGDFYGAGALIPLDSYLDTLPNFNDCYTDSYYKLMTQEDGHIYWISYQHATENRVYPAAGYYLSMDALKENDYPVVTDFDEWQRIIIDYKKAHPDFNGQPTIGFTVPTEAVRASAIEYGGSRFLAGYQNDGLTIVEPETLEAKIIMNQDFQKEFVHMMFNFWNEGVADPEMFMQTDDQYNAKIASGRVVGLYDQRWAIVNGLAALETTAPERMLLAFPVTFKGVERERYQGARNFTGGQGIGISSSAKDPDRVAQFLSDLCSEEAQILLRWGIEGEDYSVAADGTHEKSVEQWQSYSVQETRHQRGIELMTWFNLYPNLKELPGCKTLPNPQLTQGYIENVYKPFELEFLSHYADRGYTTFSSWFAPTYDAEYEVGWSIRQRIDPQNPAKIAGDTALEISLEYIPKMVQAGTEEKFEQLWQEFCGVLDTLPLKEYEVLATQMIRDSTQFYK